MLAGLFDRLSKLGFDREWVIFNTRAVVTRNVCRKKAFGAVDVAILERGKTYPAAVRAPLLNGNASCSCPGVTASLTTKLLTSKVSNTEAHISPANSTRSC